MADLSFVFDPSDLGSKIAANSAICDAASSRIAESSGTWETVAGSSDAASKVSHAKASLTSAISALSVTAASAASSDAASKITAVTAVASSDAASKASHVKASVTSAISALSVTAASAASDLVSALQATVIISDPAQNSRAVHAIMMTSKGSVKYVYSSNAVT